MYHHYTYLEVGKIEKYLELIRDWWSFSGDYFFPNFKYQIWSSKLGFKMNIFGKWNEEFGIWKWAVFEMLNRLGKSWEISRNLVMFKGKLRKYSTYVANRRTRWEMGISTGLTLVNDRLDISKGERLDMKLTKVDKKLT